MYMLLLASDEYIVQMITQLLHLQKKFSLLLCFVFLGDQLTTVPSKQNVEMLLFTFSGPKWADTKSTPC